MTDVGARLDQLNGTMKALDDRQARIEQAREMERLRGIKYLDLPVQYVNGANPLAFGGDTGTEPVSPAQGYVWFLRSLTIEGMTRGATPDVIQIRRSSATGRVIWELNGNQYIQTWGRGEKWLRAGETLFYNSVGTFAATGTNNIIISGTIEEAPAEMVGKLR